MTDATDVEDRLRQTYQAIADAVPEPSLDPPWADGAPLDLVGNPSNHDSRRLHWAAAVAAGILVIAGVTAVVGRSDSPPLQMFPAATAPPETITTAEPHQSAADEELDDHEVALALELPHVGALDTGFVDLWWWQADGLGCTIHADGTAACPTDQPGQPGWRPMYVHLTATASETSRTDDDGLTWTTVTFRVPPVAASMISDAEDRLAVTASSTAPTCVPFSPGCTERRPPPFALNS